MQRRHGDVDHLLIGNEVLLLGRNFVETISVADPIDVGTTLINRGLRPEDVGANGERLFRFDYLFRDAELPRYDPNPADLIALGMAMMHAPGTESRSTLPAGYTFLGQFIDHDLSFNANEDLSTGGPPVLLQSKRSPSLDLDSVYGFEPDRVMATPLGQEIYASPKLKEGKTVKDTSVPLASAQLSYSNDLRRIPGSKRAALVDSRNDENLAIAQTHLAFIKFHNAMVDQLTGTGSVLPDELFWRAREEVIRHYQRIILEDFLPKILDPMVLDEMQANGPQLIVLQQDEEPFMPIEFAFAAFRMGHSLITSDYEWNRVFQSDNPTPHPATLNELFVFSGSGSFNNLFFLTSSWIIDWTRFFDFHNLPVVVNEPASRSGTIDALISRRLAELQPIPITGSVTRSLAVRNLLRGLQVHLPAGQHVAQRLGYPVLSPQDFAELPYYNTLHALHFDELTPLWLYILHEAKIKNEGNRLGPVGSRIVAETVVKLIQESRVTILPPGTKWQLPPENERFRMANLLAFVNDASPNNNFLNPLG
jgi:heme peroxidase